MPKCPECIHEIEHFLYNASVSEYGTVDFEETEYDQSNSEWQSQEYRCPECDHFLGESIQDAKNALITNSEENKPKEFIVTSQEFRTETIKAKNIEEAQKLAKKLVEDNKNAELWHVREKVAEEEDNN